MRWTAGGQAAPGTNRGCGGGGGYYGGSGSAGIVIVRYASPTLDPKTVTDPTPEDIEDDITAGYFTVTGTNSEASSIIVNANYTLESNNFSFVIPSGSTITPVSGTVDFTGLDIQNISQAISNENASSKGAVKIGIPSQNLTFSNPITVTMEVQPSYNGKTLTIYSRPDSGGDWTYHGSCTVSSNLCTFTTLHATEYTGNYEVSNSPTPTDTNLDINATISISCDDTVTLGTITGTGQSSLTNNDATCNIKTNNSSGYGLTFEASNTSLTNLNGDSIGGYTPIISNTPENWSVEASASEWGAKLSSASTTYNSGTWGANDTYAGGRWLNVSNTAHQIITRTTETTQGGDNEIIRFGAEIGSNKFQPTGIYTTEVTLTATTL
jgi:hypothetical protein